MIEAIYQLGLISSLTFLGIIFISCLGAQLFSNALHWINDKKCERLLFIKKVSPGSDLVSTFMICLVIAAMASLTWPIAYPGLIIFGILYAIRKFKRFQKKVDKVFSGKADKKHRHTKDEIDT